MYYHWTSYAKPWSLARIIFEPGTANPSEPFQLLSDWRARIGAVFIIYLSISYVGPDIVWDFLENASINLFAGAFVAIAVVLIFWLTSPSPLSPTVRHNTWAALKRALLSLAITFAFGALVRANVVAAIPLLGLFLGLWLVIFVLAMLWYCLRWVFGVSKADKLLGPVVSAVTAVLAFGWDAIGDEPDPRPDRIQAMIKLSGLATVCLLALWEFLYALWARRDVAFAGSAYDPEHLSADPQRPAGPWNGLAIASLPAALLVWPAGVVLAVLALRQVRETGERGAGLAWASLVVVVVSLLLTCLIVGLQE